ncbi:uncharacterized protein tp53i13 [Parambassis ranga]|uniref:Uncharacterized protein tp53i13 n=1 Tax=Parambassis ranga TaxID=210632 RepID=A0A6P7JHF2_9TELE|nr:tumor protein p53-inducible protein 13 [Parambassis ranga]
MPNQTTSPPLTVTLLAALWVSLSRCGGSGCDNGKLSLDMDLPVDALYWDCAMSTWPESFQKRQSIDTVYDPEPARQICMDTSISYNQNIPNSGAYRPVSAESGEYLYCPPQRWLNNLHHGATVLLYHPCAPHHEHHLLSSLVRSCLSDYIITPHPQLNKHMPLAFVSWGRTLELSNTATSDICDWLRETTQTKRNTSDSVSARRRYNLLLTRPAGLHTQEQSTTLKDSLRQCCEQTISTLLSATETELEPSMKMEHLKQITGREKSRQIRAAIRGNQVNIQGADTTSKNKSILTKSNNRTVSQRTGSFSTLGPSAASPLILRGASQSMVPNQGLTPRPTHRTDSLGFVTFPSKKGTLMQPNLKNPNSFAEIDVVKSVQNPEALTPKDTDSIKQKDKDSNKDSVKVNELKEKHVDKNHKAEGKIKHNEVVQVKEREVEHKQLHSGAHNKSKKSSSDSVSESHSESHPQQNPQTAGSSQANSRDCDSCKAGEHCDCTKASGPEARFVVVNNGLLRTPRTDEAAWAAAALGFLLVLLTLSVLHTRLYRYWRTSPSLYWHDPRQDYDSVADVIRRRLKIANRRRKRGRRQECALLPSSSSSDEYP